MEITLLIMEKSWNCVFESFWEPCKKLDIYKEAETDISSWSVMSSIQVIFSMNLLCQETPKKGVQWLSGRVLDSRLRGRGFEPHWHHCVVVLGQDTFILA